MTFPTYKPPRNVESPRGSYTRKFGRYQGKQRSFQFSLRDLEAHIEIILHMIPLSAREAPRWSMVCSEEERKAIVAMHDCIKGKLWELRRLGRI